MASISTDKAGRRRILFVAPDGSRKQVRLGKVPLRAATSIKLRVELLVSALENGHGLDPETARWLEAIDGKLREKLVRVGLAEPREHIRLAAFIDGYIAMRSDVKQSTATVYGHTRRCLVEFFGADKPLREITPGDADAWRIYLKTSEKLAENTVRKRCGIAKQFFRAAMKQKLVSENPFADLVSAVRGNASRFYFVSREETQAVLDACPDAQWRLLFALSRYGGLRCPSEHLRLRWGDIDWERGRIHVRSPKTEHHEGKESRIVPLFPELRPYLEECFELAEPGTEHVVTLCRDTGTNLRTQLKRIIRKAGLEPWPKLFHNLRSTRQTELEESWPSHVVCSWLGNSQAVAGQHYLQTTDEHFERAAQNPAQHGAKSHLTAQQPEGPAHEKAPVLQGQEASNSCLSQCQVVSTGLEPVTSTMSTLVGYSAS